MFDPLILIIVLKNSLSHQHSNDCYELCSGNILAKPVECGPGAGPMQQCDETIDIQEGLRKLAHVSPQMFFILDVYEDRTFLVTSSDGLDPIFSLIDELLVIGGDMIVFIVYPC